ncbi:hypothetical protein ESCO_004733 [Escovopsis weberi]|uniref:Uncharacterized protein n=1 Tax=Escovopsis weberi TaxID=150374 RepID=A0A0N0RSU5_ESCWE|nr:hypothetical protein ESCO_004733 [Escovopsis weberi]
MSPYIHVHIPFLPPLPPSKPPPADALAAPLLANTFFLLFPEALPTPLSVVAAAPVGMLLFVALTCLGSACGAVLARAVPVLRMFTTSPLFTMLYSLFLPRETARSAPRRRIPTLAAAAAVGGAHLLVVEWVLSWGRLEGLVLCVCVLCWVVARPGRI